MKVVMISEKRLDELVKAMLNRLELRETKHKNLDFHAVNYEVYVLLEKIVEGDIR